MYNKYQQRRHQPQHFIQNGNRSRSETRLYHDQQTNMHLSPRYENRLVNGSGAPISTNPLWTSVSPSLAGSQPNLLSHENFIDSAPLRHQRNSHIEKNMSSTPSQHPLYASYPDNKPGIIMQQQENQQKTISARTTST